MYQKLYRNRRQRPVAAALLWALWLMFFFQHAKAQNGPICTSFTNKSFNAYVRGVYVSGNNVYIAINDAGLGISTDGGNNFSIYPFKGPNSGPGPEGGRNYQALDVWASGSNVYVATGGGLYITADNGASFTRKTTSDGLGSNFVYGVYAVGNTVYAATGGGVSISTDGGQNFTNYTNGLGSTTVNGVFAVGNNVYAATFGGLSISTDGGQSFSNYTTGLAINNVQDVYVVGNTIYAATRDYTSTDKGGLSISTNGGQSFTNKTTANGLGANSVQGVYAVGNTVYAASGDLIGNGGVSISTDGGATFTNYTAGLGSNIMYGISVVGNTIYAATEGGLSFCSACSPVTPSVTIASDDADNSITSGTSVNFTATPINGGSSPSYQ